MIDYIRFLFYPLFIALYYCVLFVLPYTLRQVMQTNYNLVNNTVSLGWKKVDPKIKKHSTSIHKHVVEAFDHRITHPGSYSSSWY